MWPPLFSCTALTLLGMEFTRASQVVTGALFHSFVTTSWSWWMLETDAQQRLGLETCLASPSPLPSASLTRQWSSWMCIWGCYHVGILRPSLRREGIMLCFSMSQYMLAFMDPSMNCSSPVPAALMQPQTMTLPPPCLTVGKTLLSLYSSPVMLDTCWTK